MKLIRVQHMWALIVVCSCVRVVVANVNLTECVLDVSKSHGLSLANSSLTELAKHVTYDECRHCESGKSVGTFNWTAFSQNFSAWLLPWVALIFQLPFGADDRFDNLIAVLLAVGSPALAGYSLAITRLNGRWLEREFVDKVNYPNSEIVPVAFAALQHVPIKLVEQGALLSSLIVLPQNDQWWASMARTAGKTRGWNIPAAFNILWVIIAFLLTIIDSFTDFPKFVAVPGDAGYALVAIYSFLIPLVVGWLNVGSQPDANHLRTGLEEANLNVWVATPGEPTMAATIAGRPSRAVEYAKRDVRRVQSDEKRTAPIFNYSRAFIWSQQAARILELYENASRKADQKISVSGSDWVLGEHGVDRKNRTGGSEAQVIGYCMDADPTPFSMALESLEMPEPMMSAGTSETKFEPDHLPSYFSRRNARRTLWAPHVSDRVTFAFVLALVLQWGTAGSAVMIHMQTPPKGIGCRSLTFTLYGATGTIVFFVMFLSSVLAHRARPLERYKTTTITQDIQETLAIGLRWIGKTLGVLNGVGIIVASIMQFSGIYANCFCSSTVFGSDEGVIHLTDPLDNDVVKFWIGGVIMAFGCCSLYAAAIYVGSPMNRK